MPPDDPNSHHASIEVSVPAERAFAFMADGLKQDHWALGSMDRQALGGDLFRGTSRFDGTQLYVKLDSDPDRLLVDYSIGPDPNELMPMVEARIRRGEWLGRDPSVSIVTLSTWRWPHASEEEWRRTYYTWHTEMYLIKGAIERGL